jgi:hypothetical protein
MEQVVKRLLEQWDALKIFFQSKLTDNIPTAVSIHEGLGNVKLRIFYLFLGYILLVVNELNLEFQSESVRVHQILKKVRETLKEIMQKFIKQEVVDRSDPFKTNVRSPNNLRPYENVYFGPKFLALCEGMSGDADFSRKLISVKNKCFMFYQRLYEEIIRRVDSSDEFLVQLDCFDPKVAVSDRINSLVGIYSWFSTTVSFDIDQLDRD